MVCRSRNAKSALVTRVQFRVAGAAWQSDRKEDMEKREQDRAVVERGRVMTAYSYLIEAEENVSLALKAMNNSVEDELREQMKSLYSEIGSTLDDFNVPKR